MAMLIPLLIGSWFQGVIPFQSRLAGEQGDLRSWACHGQGTLAQHQTC